MSGPISVTELIDNFHGTTNITLSFKHCANREISFMYETTTIRPYALIENVVTHKEFRKKGYATECLNYAKGIAEREQCYKMMLLTGSKNDSTLRFYRNAKYNSADKTAFIQ